MSTINIYKQQQLKLKTTSAAYGDFKSTNVYIINYNTLNCLMCSKNKEENKTEGDLTKVSNGLNSK